MSEVEITHEARFQDVGRGKRSWKASFKALRGDADRVASFCHDEVRRNGGLASRFPDVTVESEDEGETWEGKVFAGFHTVGRIAVRVIEEE